MDLLKIAGMGILVWGVTIAAPVFGVIVGSGFAAWFLYHAYKEQNNGS